MKKTGILLSLILISCVFVSPVLAYKTINGAQNALTQVADPTGISKDDLQTSTGKFIKNALTLVGTIFFGLMIYGGFLWMTARGEEDQIKKGKETIIAAVIGMAVILAAYAVTNVVTSGLITKSTGSKGNACADKLTSCTTNCSPPDGSAAALATAATCRNKCDTAFSQCIQ